VAGACQGGEHEQALNGDLETSMPANQQYYTLQSYTQPKSTVLTELQKRQIRLQRVLVKLTSGFN